MLEFRLLSGRVVRTHVLWINSHKQYDFLDFSAGRKMTY